MAQAWEIEMQPRHPFASVPPDTIKKARAIMGRDNFYLKVGDNWAYLLAETLYFSSEKNDASQHWMVPTLAIATLLQYKEKLSDRQVEEASRLRVDWKYALHLSMYYPALTRAMLCKYRQRVYHNLIYQQEFQSVLDRFIEKGFYQDQPEQRLTAIALLDEVCSHSRLEEITLALRHALEALATHHPRWLRDIIQPHWYTRYHLFEAAPDLHQSLDQQSELTETIGADVIHLFEAIAHSDMPELDDFDEVKVLKHVWLEQFEPARNGEARRLPKCSFCGTLLISSASGK
jgi:Transposase domain (DUF772)